MLLATLRNKFLRDTATLQVAGGLNQLSQVLSSVLVAFLLGAVGQGRFAVAVVLQGLVYNLINVGSVQATVSQLASASARGLVAKVSAWMAYLAKFYLLFNGLLIVLGWLLLPRIGEWWYGDRDLGVLAAWLCIWPILDTPRAVVFAAFQGTRRMLRLAQLGERARADAHVPGVLRRDHHRERARCRGRRDRVARAGLRAGGGDVRTRALRRRPTFAELARCAPTHPRDPAAQGHAAIVPCRSAQERQHVVPAHLPQALAGRHGGHWPGWPTFTWRSASWVCRWC